MFAQEIRRAAEAAPLAKLIEVSAALWKAFAAGGMTEAEAEEISGLIEARKACRDTGITGPAAPRRVGSRPRTDASMDRRRRWAASGRLPPQLAARFTLAEQAALAVVAAEVVKRGDCRLCHEAVAAVAGVSRSTVRAALRRARDLGAVGIEERRLTPWRSLPSVVRITAPEWKAWNRLGRRSAGPTSLCDKAPAPTNTKLLDLPLMRPEEATKRASGRRMAGPFSVPRQPSRSAVAGSMKR